MSNQGINILLVDYHRLILYDELLPAGRLREPKSGKDRADIVIITKCPPDLKPVDYRVLTKAMNLFPYQEVVFLVSGLRRAPQALRRRKKNARKHPQPPCAAAHGHCLATTNGAGSHALCHGDPARHCHKANGACQTLQPHHAAVLPRPPCVQGQGHSENQRGVRKSARAQTRHHDGEGRCATGACRGAERSVAKVSLCPSAENPVYAGSGRKIQ